MSVKSTIKVCGVAVLVLLIIFAALGPGKWQLRTGLGWEFDHIAGFFAFTLTICLVWTRPLVVGGLLMAFAVLLEAPNVAFVTLCLPSLVLHNSNNPPNRRIRTRTYGGVGGAAP